MRRIFFFAVGVLLSLVGIVGLFLPILQGWLFIFLGLSMIAPRLAQRLRSRLFRKLFKSDVVHLKEWKKGGIRAGFTTRRFPLVLKRTEDLLEAQTQHKLASLMPFKKFAVLGQVHGSGIAVLDDPEKYSHDGFYHCPRTDGAVTDLAGLTLLVLSADCLPIFFVCGGWVGLAHAGWRGTRDRIAGQMVRCLKERSGLHPRHIHVAFGPCISAKYYEVGPEFKDYFRPSSISEKDGKVYFDLAKENETQLVRAGVKRRHISNHGICTFSENGDFYSFRREKEGAGRLISFIGRS